MLSHRRQIARFAAAHNTVFATHDPDSESAVTEAAAMRASICEFPLTLDAAAAARQLCRWSRARPVAC